MDSSPHGWGTGALAVGFVAVGVVASILTSLSVAADNASTAEQWLEERGHVVQAATEGTVKTAIDGLSALAAFFENSEDITEDEFEGFVSSLDPAIRLLGVAYMPVVPKDGLDDYVAAKQETTPGYSITAFDADGELQPVVRDRPAYYPVELFSSGPFLLESIADTRAAVAELSVGYDAGSPAEWRHSFEYSITGDTPAVSGFLEIAAGETVVGKAFIVSVPVHDDAGTIVGLTAAPMVDFLLADFAQTRGVTWTISSGDADPAGTDGLAWEQMIELPGAVWDLVVVPTDESLSGMSGLPPWVVAVAGLVLTGAVAVLFVLARQRSRTRRRVEEMERVAIEKDQFLASVSHEIRTPLTVVAGLAHELRDRPRSFEPEETMELLALVAQQSDEVAAMPNERVPTSARSRAVESPS